MHPSQRPILVPAPEIIVDRAFRRQIPRDIPPLTAGAQDIHQTVHHLTDVDRALVASGFARRDQRLDHCPFLVRQVVAVAQARAVMVNASLGGPHWTPRKSDTDQDSKYHVAG
jgi:hypothetical protein